MDVLDRFLVKVDHHKEDDSCWEWLGARMPNGYGLFRSEGRSRSVHRVAFELQHGSIPAGKNVNHHCDNRGCVKPEHLYAGSSADNARDTVERGRHHFSMRTHCHRGHAFPEDGGRVRMVKGKPTRVCRECKNLLAQRKAEK